MERNQADASPDTVSQSGSAFADLRGRQSVRATFKLTNDCIEAISIVANQLGIKQKSLFDHLAQDKEALSAIARKFQNAKLQTSRRVQKTYVISRSTLVHLEDIASSFNAPRDVLIEYSVQRLLPIITNERKRHEQRKAIFEKVRRHLSAGREMLQSAFSELGEEDPLVDRLAAAIGVYESAFQQIADFIEKSKIIEEFDPGAFQKIDIVFEDQ